MSSRSGLASQRTASLAPTNLFRSTIGIAVVLIATVALAGASLGASPQHARPEARQLARQVVQVDVVYQNISGAQVFDGSAAAVNQAIQNSSSDTEVVMLSEVCQSQFEAFRDVPGHATWSEHFFIVKQKPECGATRTSAKRSSHLTRCRSSMLNAWLRHPAMMETRSPPYGARPSRFLGLRRMR